MDSTSWQLEIPQVFLGPPPCTREIQKDPCRQGSGRVAEFHVEFQHGFVDFDRYYMKKVFQWGGHLARLAQYDADRLTYRALLHKRWDWIQMIAAEFKGNQLHGRKLKIWRWEQKIYKHFKESWLDVAYDKSVWNEHVDRLVGQMGEGL